MSKLMLNMIVLLLFVFLPKASFCQTDTSVFNMNDTSSGSPFFLKPKKQNKNVFFGVASYYGDKFEGRKTASGQVFSQQKWTAACNRLPLGTRIKVTNIRNGKSVEVIVNDRLHPKMKRVVDLTKIAAKKLGFLDHGLTKVKVEVIGDAKNKKK